MFRPINSFKFDAIICTHTHIHLDTKKQCTKTQYEEPQINSFMKYRWENNIKKFVEGCKMLTPHGCNSEVLPSLTTIDLQSIESIENL
jgi:hypothetical protein